MFRNGLGVVFSLVAVGFALAGFSAGHDSPAGSFLLNLASEVGGIVITVGLVEWFVERRKNWDAAKKLAWHVLDDLDQAVWVWQGGRRELSVDELYGLLEAIGDEDKIAPFTATLLMRNGSAAQIICRRQGDLVSANHHLEKALGYLAQLAAIRDSKRTLPAKLIKWPLLNAVSALAAAVDFKIAEIPTEEINRLRDPSVEGQGWRYVGRRLSDRHNALKAPKNSASKEG
jgi:hypothetical protein